MVREVQQTTITDAFKCIYMSKNTITVHMGDPMMASV